jgi:hypothetical protein
MANECGWIRQKWSSTDRRVSREDVNFHRVLTVDVEEHGMSRPDSARSPSDTQGGDRIVRQDEFAADLNARGHSDVLVLRRENGRTVLTEGRLALIQALSSNEDIYSVSDLARRVNRDKGAVSKDLRRLAELDVIMYEGEGDGEAKRPVLKHSHVVIEPIVY